MGNLIVMKIKPALDYKCVTSVISDWSFKSCVYITVLRYPVTPILISQSESEFNIKMITCVNNTQVIMLTCS